MERPLATDAARKMNLAFPLLTQSVNRYDGSGASAYVWIKKTVDNQYVQAMCLEFDPAEQQDRAANALQAFANASGVPLERIKDIVRAGTERIDANPAYPIYREPWVGATVTVTRFASGLSIRVDYE